MNATHSIELLVFGLLVVGLNAVATRMSPAFAGATQTLLVAGGLLITFLGVLGLGGFRRRTLPIVATVVVAGLLVVQAVRAWISLTSGVEGVKPVAVIYSLLLVCAIVQLVNLAQPGRPLESGRGKIPDGATGEDGVKSDKPKHDGPTPNE